MILPEDPEPDPEPVLLGQGGLALMSTGEDTLSVLRAAGVRIKGDPETPGAFRASFSPKQP
jgi:hypothetical protein